VCLAVAQVLLCARSEHHWLRRCYARLGHLFPAAAMDDLAREFPSSHDQVRLIDATPVPVRHLAGNRQALAAGRVGQLRYCAAHSRWYWGLKLYVITTPDGMPVAWCLAGSTTPCSTQDTTMVTGPFGGSG
jgi:hypothetical protein